MSEARTGLRSEERVRSHEVVDRGTRDAVVTTAWVAEHLADPDVVLVEVGATRASYRRGHLPGAVGWSWAGLQWRARRRPILQQLSELAGASGIDAFTTVVLYGDRQNRYATRVFGLLLALGHPHLKLMDGGRQSWVRQGRPLTRELPSPLATTYHPLASGADRDGPTSFAWISNAV